MKLTRSLILSFLTIMLASCTGTLTSIKQSDTHGSAATLKTVSIMTFNVENLFDTTHDEGKNDYTYMPISAKDNATHRARCEKIPVQKWRNECLNWDWTEEIVDYKLSKIAQVLQSVNDGRGPDIIAFQEVENIHLLNRLVNEYLPDAGYLNPVLIEGNDLRGIDVAFLSRFELARGPQLHPITFREIEQQRLEDTRGILQADFMLPDGSELTGFAVHFPAPFHPWPLRVDSYQSLNKLVARLPKNRAAFAAGDFNTPAAEDREHQMLDLHVDEHWVVAHQVGCEGCLGTHYYAPKKEWSFLDMIIVRRNTESAWRLDRQKTRLVNSLAAQSTEDGYPARFEREPLSGVSDHWPLLIELSQ